MDYSSRLHLSPLWWQIVLDTALFRFFRHFQTPGIRSTESARRMSMMADDIVAGIYGAIIILLINVFIIMSDIRQKNLCG